MKKTISKITVVFVLFLYSFISARGFVKRKMFAAKIIRRKNVNKTWTGFQFLGLNSKQRHIFNLNSLPNKYIYAIIFTALVYYNGCKDNNPVVPPTKTENTFAIYFLKDTTLTIKDILNKNLADLVLADRPWISQDDIDFYDWSSHCIYLKKDKSCFFPNYYEGYYALPKSWTDRPWIVVANSIPCYQGYFVTDASMDFFPFPEISALQTGTWGYPKDIITSEWPYWSFNADPRENESVKSSLMQNNLYHGGIGVFLDTINSPIKIFNGDTTTVEYTIQIKNNDTDNLYVFDSDKVDNEIYHHYNNGPDFFNNSTYVSYESRYKKEKKPNAWTSSWYTLLKSGEVIKRTIKLKGYPIIPIGKYLVELRYFCPTEGLNKNIREELNGRYWVGQTRSNPVLLTFTNNNSKSLALKIINLKRIRTMKSHWKMEIVNNIME